MTGKRAFPFHSHRVNEEMFFVLEGKGEIRIGTETYPVTRGDVISEYPDSEKVGVLAEFLSEDGGKPTVMRYIIRDQADMADYWEGE